MDLETWIVRTPVGDEWGVIKRLILDSTTRQISHADVIVTGTGNIIRISWDNVVLRNKGFSLNSAHREVEAAGLRPALENLGGALAMDLWP